LLQLLLEEFLAALRLLELVEEALNFFGVGAVVAAALTDRRGTFESFAMGGRPRGDGSNGTRVSTRASYTS